jgi:hypothetical protein
MDIITRAVIAYLAAVFFLLVSAGFFLNRALAPLPQAETKTATIKSLAPKLVNSAERRTEDTVLMQRLADEAERRAHPPVETTGASSAMATPPADADRTGEAKTNRKSKVRAVEERAEKQRLAWRYQERQFYNAWGYQRSYGSWRFSRRGF